jgi:hypothetical protein
VGVCKSTGKVLLDVRGLLSMHVAEGAAHVAHPLTPTQRAGRRLPIGGLRTCWPKCFEFCLTGEETKALFRAHFLTRLSTEIRVHLEAVEEVSLK